MLPRVKAGPNCVPQLSPSHITRRGCQCRHSAEASLGLLLVLGVLALIGHIHFRAIDQVQTVGAPLVTVGNCVDWRAIVRNVAIAAIGRTGQDLLVLYRFASGLL